MDGDWEEVKTKKKFKPKPAQQSAGGDFGGKNKKGGLVAGAVQ